MGLERDSDIAHHIRQICSGTDAQRAKSIRAIDEQHRFSLERFFMSQRQFADAEDLAQQVLIKLLDVACGFQGTGHGRAWLMRIARNLMVDHIRVQGRRRQSDAGSGAPEGTGDANPKAPSGDDHDREYDDGLQPERAQASAGWPVGVPDWGDDIATKDLVAKTMAILHRHSPDHAIVIQQRVLHGMDHAELAEMFDRSPGAMREYASQAQKMTDLIVEALMAGRKPADILADLKHFNARQRRAA